MAEIILGTPAKPADPAPLLDRARRLSANERKDEPSWWNDLAGAYIRLGKPDDAVALLEPVKERFSGDYGIHANLGTAYHLMGRYPEAEREISRDLEINPDAHFGVEKYHLALLQYLIRDDEYRKAHVYVDEFSKSFLVDEWHYSDLMYWQSGREETIPAGSDSTNSFPPYRLKWNLAADTNFEAGVRYMAELNPREPACFVMLGVACFAKQNRDLNLAIAAFQKAIDLGSPQSDILQQRIAVIQKHIDAPKAWHRSRTRSSPLIVGLFVIACVLLLFRFLLRKPG